MSLQQGLPILYGVEWNGQMEHPGLAASHTSEDEDFYAFLSDIEEGGLCPKNI